MGRFRVGHCIATFIAATWTVRVSSQTICSVDSDCPNECCANVGVCSVFTLGGQAIDDECLADCDCEEGFCLFDIASSISGRCASLCQTSTDCSGSLCCENSGCSVFDEASRAGGVPCFDNCECRSGLCEDMSSFGIGTCADESTPAPVLPPGFTAAPVPAPTPGVGNDPHLLGLHGQDIEFHGVEGGWYALYEDKAVGLQVNVRPTAPLPNLFPERQYITGAAILLGDHSIVIEIKDPYTSDTEGCPENISPCLANGALTIAVDGREVDALLAPSRDEYVAKGIELSSTNLPVECREFGGARAWARLREQMALEQRSLKDMSFEDWVLRFDNMVSPEYCAKHISEQALDDVNSKQALFRISMPTAVVRFSVGLNHRRSGKMNKVGRMLPTLDFWQGAVGLDGLSLDEEHLSRVSGMIGETFCIVRTEAGEPVMEGIEALRGSVSDYLVSSPLGKDFAFVHEECPTF